MVDVELVHVLYQLVTGTRRMAVPGFELRDLATSEVQPRVTGRAQSATCVFCRKTIAAWRARARPARPRAPLPMPVALAAAIAEHQPACAEQWMWSVLARWAIGFATPEEHAAITAWRERHVDEGAWRRAPALVDVFARLPQPPGSEMAQQLEVALIAISRLWEPA